MSTLSGPLLSGSKLKTLKLAKLQKADPNKIRKIQLVMLKSKANLLYSIRRVTSQNRGRKTSGIDKLVYMNVDTLTSSKN